MDLRFADVQPRERLREVLFDDVVHGLVVGGATDTHWSVTWSVYAGDNKSMNGSSPLRKTDFLNHGMRT